MWDAFARYEDSAQVAAFLEAEWSDHLFGVDPDKTSFDCDPKNDRASPKFYRRVAGLLATHAFRLGLSIERCCDVGGATGRLLYELKGHFPQAHKWVLIVPSSSLCAWAGRILLEQPRILTVPTVGAWSHSGEATVSGFASRFEEGEDSIQILQSTLEDLPQQPDRFDLISCCNVIDRCNDPHTLVNTLSDRVRRGGLLLLTSPLEFDLRRTGEVNQDDLKAFTPNHQWKILSDTDETYDLRVSRRKWVRYSSQVLILERKGDGI
jgi:SAM-dependent methyltransferase